MFSGVSVFLACLFTKNVTLYAFLFLLQRVMGAHLQDGTCSSSRLRLPRGRQSALMAWWTQLGPITRGTGGSGNRTRDLPPDELMAYPPRHLPMLAENWISKRLGGRRNRRLQCSSCTVCEGSIPRALLTAAEADSMHFFRPKGVFG